MYERPETRCQSGRQSLLSAHRQPLTHAITASEATKMRTLLVPVAAGLLTAAVIATPAALATRHSSATASSPEVVGFGLQSNQPGAPDGALFGVYASGLGSAASGIVEF